MRDRPTVQLDDPRQQRLHQLLSDGGPAMSGSLSARLAAADAARPTLLRVSFEGLRYPDWNRRFGWRATGLRSDSIGGRRTETVFYRHVHHRIGYTVVGGPPLRPPASSLRLTVAGVEVHAYKDGIRDVIVFARGGHTCVLAGFVHHRSTLLELAAWKGHGAITF